MFLDGGGMPCPLHYAQTSSRGTPNASSTQKRKRFHADSSFSEADDVSEVCDGGFVINVWNKPWCKPARTHTCSKRGRCVSQSRV